VGDKHERAAEKARPVQEIFPMADPHGLGRDFGCGRGEGSDLGCSGAL
jgi:hypothetical protein